MNGELMDEFQGFCVESDRGSLPRRIEKPTPRRISNYNDRSRALQIALSSHAPLFFH